MILLSDSEKFAFERIRLWLNKSCGMYYPLKKQQLLLQRLKRVCNIHNFPTLNNLANALEHEHSTNVQLTVISAASTNHTYFFREPQVLNYFQDVILPTLNTETRIWSAATSTGDEAYTIAMIAAEAKGLDWVKRNLNILGTDIDKLVIANAEEAIYKYASLEHTPEFIRNRYFNVLTNNQYQVNKTMRDLCTFRRMNLKMPSYPFKNMFDVVFCRNVLYYFDEMNQTQVVENIYDVTRKGGYLLTSVTVSLRHLNTRWINVTSGVYRKE